MSRWSQWEGPPELGVVDLASTYIAAPAAIVTAVVSAPSSVANTRLTAWRGNSTEYAQYVRPDPVPDQPRVIGPDRRQSVVEAVVAAVGDGAGAAGRAVVNLANSPATADAARTAAAGAVVAAGSAVVGSAASAVACAEATYVCSK